MAIDYGSTLKKYVNVLSHEGGSDLHQQSVDGPDIRAGATSARGRRPA